jgi:hypothetical protein
LLEGLSRREIRVEADLNGWPVADPSGGSVADLSGRPEVSGD